MIHQPRLIAQSVNRRMVNPKTQILTTRLLATIFRCSTRKYWHGARDASPTETKASVCRGRGAERSQNSSKSRDISPFLCPPVNNSVHSHDRFDQSFQDRFRASTESYRVTRSLNLLSQDSFNHSHGMGSTVKVQRHSESPEGSSSSSSQKFHSS